MSNRSSQIVEILTKIRDGLAVALSCFYKLVGLPVEHGVYDTGASNYEPWTEQKEFKK